MMTFLERITDRLFYSQFDHVHKEFNRTRVEPVHGEATYNIGGVASNTTLDTIEFEVPQGGAIVCLDVSGLVLFTSFAATGTVGLRFLLDNESAGNNNSALLLVTHLSGHNQTYAHVRTKELSQGKHSFTVKSFRNQTGTVSATCNYRVTQWVK